MRAAPDLLSTADDIVPHFTPTSKEDEAFAEYYEREIRPLMGELEARRQNALAVSRRSRPFYITTLLGLLLCVAIYGVGTLSDEPRPRYFVALALVPVFIAAWAAASIALHRATRAFEEFRHAAILPKVVAFFGDFTYARKGTVSVADAAATHIVPLGNIFRANDEIRGTYRGTAVTMSEITTVRTGGKRDVTLFHGMLISVDFPKPFHGTTVIGRERGQERVMGRAGDLETVRLEDPRFEKVFEVLSDDQVEARYLLTPDFMTRLLDLRATIIGRLSAAASWLDGPLTLDCSFVDRRLAIAASTEVDLFELRSAAVASDDFPRILRIHRQIRDLLGLIDLLEITKP
jgi:hypothetical protein